MKTTTKTGLLMTLGALFLIPNVVGQTETSIENFDDDVLGNTAEGVNPSEAFYSFERLQQSGNCNTALTISTTGAISGQSLRYAPTAADDCADVGARIGDIDGNPAASSDPANRPLVSQVAWKLGLTSNTNKNFYGRIGLRQDSTTLTAVSWQYSSGSICAAIIDFSISPDIDPADCVDPGDPSHMASGVSNTALLSWTMRINYVTLAVNVSESTTNTFKLLTLPFEPNYITAYQWFGDSTTGTLTTDRIVTIDSTSMVRETVSSSASNPINVAKNRFADSWGFSEQAVGWLFSLFIVGACVVGVKERGPLAIAIMAMIGVAVSFFLGFLPAWFLLVLIFVVIAVAGGNIFRPKDGDGDG